MVLSRNAFFILIFFVLACPFVVYKVIWISRSQKTMGRVLFRGRRIEVQGTSDYWVIKYKAGNDSLFFDTEDDLDMVKGALVSVRYQKDWPAEACVNSFVGIWLETTIYALFPLLIIAVLFLTPEKYDPLIPRKSTIVVGKKPFFQIITPDHRVTR
jgi:hypothetical protein